MRRQSYSASSKTVTRRPRASVEVITGILAPLLHVPDEVFSTSTMELLLNPEYSSSRYLLVCKAWLRIGTPLLYDVVILRTTFQADALAAVLEARNDLGLHIKKLRVEGGFGDSMETVLRLAPNITDIFFTLGMWGGGVHNPNARNF
ncbi:hypothetical protein R3P38DRAFT_2555040 [Favolaschia claudopus]|uniref:Uncharacterized protein n=1 Tax=Favolaschia claudopus TaxID=2862362 RepID=A0AAW0AD79_9AGAR